MEIALRTILYVIIMLVVITIVVLLILRSKGIAFEKSRLFGRYFEIGTVAIERVDDGLSVSCSNEPGNKFKYKIRMGIQMFYKEVGELDLVPIIHFKDHLIRGYLETTNEETIRLEGIVRTDTIWIKFETDLPIDEGPSLAEHEFFTLTLWRYDRRIDDHFGSNTVVDTKLHDFIKEFAAEYLGSADVVGNIVAGCSDCGRCGEGTWNPCTGDECHGLSTDYDKCYKYRMWNRLGILDCRSCAVLIKTLETHTCGALTPEREDACERCDEAIGKNCYWRGVIGGECKECPADVSDCSELDRYSCTKCDEAYNLDCEWHIIGGCTNA